MKTAEVVASDLSGEMEVDAPLQAIESFRFEYDDPVLKIVESTIEIGRAHV